MTKASASKKKATSGKGKAETTPAKTVTAGQKPSTSSTATTSADKMHKDNSFREYRRICADIANASSYLTKTAIVRNFFNKGTKGG